MEFLEHLQYWHWLIFGIVLIILEIFVPSAVLLWPGIAAIVTGVLAYGFGISPLTLIILWAVLSVACAFGWQLYRRMHPSVPAAPTMNRRGEQYVGRHFTLAKDIVNGIGELHVDDTRWKVVSYKDFSAGVKVKVVAVEGTALRVDEYLS